MGHFKGLRMIKWTKEACIINAQLYSTKAQWRKAKPSNYSRAVINGWLPECSAHFIPPFRWTKELCIEDAKSYENRTQWSEAKKSGYAAARKNGWLDECLALEEKWNILWVD